MPEDIRSRVKRLSTAELNNLKRQLASVPERQRATIYRHYADVPELQDIVGTSLSQVSAQPTQPRPTAKKDIPLWQKALKTFNAPFDWVEKNISQPFGAVVTAPFTPSTGTEVPGESWLAREKREYNAWKGPDVLPGGGTFRPVKGMVEFLPWLAPTALSAGAGAGARALGSAGKAGQALGKLGQVAKAGESITGFAEQMGKVGKAGSVVNKIAKGVGTAAKLSPWGLAETATNAGLKFAGKTGLKLAGGIGEKFNSVLSDISKSQNVPVEFVKLHLNPARTEGLAAVDKAVALKYLKSLKPYANDEVLYNRMIRSFNEGDLNDAGSIAEGFLQTYHMNKSGENYVQMADLLPTPEGAVGLAGKQPAGKKPTPKEGADQVVGDIIKAKDSRLIDKMIAAKQKAEPIESPVAQGLKSAEEKIAQAAEEVAPTVKATTPRQPPKPPKFVSTIMPNGFNKKTEGSIEKLIALTKESKGLRAATESMYTEQRAERIVKFEQAVEKGVKTKQPSEITLAKAAKKLGGEFEQAPVTEEFATLREGLNTKDIENLFGVIAKADYKSGYDRVNTFKALQDLLLGKIPQKNQLASLEDTFGSGLAKAILDKRSLWTKAVELVLDIANAPRALLSSFDISGVLRQGGVLSAAHPMSALRSFEPMIKAMFSDKNEALMDAIIRARPNFMTGVKSGLYIAPRVGRLTVPLAGREEAFMSKFLNWLPGIKASNRAYVTGLNDLRSRVWEDTLTMWQKSGLKITEQDTKDLAQFINWATGRGTMPKGLKGENTLLNAMFFSPKLILSRLELPTAMLPGVTKSALARREAQKTLMTAVGVGAGLLAAAKLSGAADVELDPRSADFGKLKVGDQRLDIWTGYTQYLRFIAQLSTGQSKSQSGNINTMSRKQIADRFISSKLSPAAGLINDLLKGETYMGDQLPPTNAQGWGKAAWERWMPLGIQDMVDGVNQAGALGGVIASASLLGIGTTTYTSEVKKLQDIAAREEYGLTWEEVGKTFGALAQTELAAKYPEIAEAEKEAETRFAGNKTVMSQWFKDGESIEQNYRKSVTLASQELRATGDFATFRNKMSDAATTKRQMYAARADREEYKDIVADYAKPLSDADKAKMNINDILRREYYQTMYSAEMYDKYGNYNFQLASQKEKDFINKYGQAVVDYIDDYQGSQWADKPPEVQQFEAAKTILKPYWDIENQVWAQYDPNLKVISDEILLLEQSVDKLDQRKAKIALYRYPQIMMARNMIARQKKMMRRFNPQIDLAYTTYYG